MKPWPLRDGGNPHILSENQAFEAEQQHSVRGNAILATQST